MAGGDPKIRGLTLPREYGASHSWQELVFLNAPIGHDFRPRNSNAGCGDAKPGMDSRYHVRRINGFWPSSCYFEESHEGAQRKRLSSRSYACQFVCERLAIKMGQIGESGGDAFSPVCPQFAPSLPPLTAAIKHDVERPERIVIPGNDGLT